MKSPNQPFILVFCNKMTTSRGGGAIKMPHSAQWFESFPRAVQKTTQPTKQKKKAKLIIMQFV